MGSAAIVLPPAWHRELLPRDVVSYTLTVPWINREIRALRLSSRNKHSGDGLVESFVFFRKGNNFVLFLIFIYFLYYFFGCVGSQLLCASFSLHRAGFSLVVACGFSLFSLARCPGSRARGLCSLRHTGSLIEACELSCPEACGILVPRPGVEPESPALEGGFFTPGPPGKSQKRNNLSSFIFPLIYLKTLKKNTLT